MNNNKLTTKYARQSIRYLSNGFNALQKGDVDKASEFFWGSMAQAIKAVAIKRGVRLRSHGELWNYAKGLAKELNDESVYDAFFKANSLHSNFYETRLEQEDVGAVANSIKMVIGKLLESIGYQFS